MIPNSENENPVYRESGMRNMGNVKKRKEKVV